MHHVRVLTTLGLVCCLTIGCRREATPETLTPPSDNLQVTEEGTPNRESDVRQRVTALFSADEPNLAEAEAAVLKVGGDAVPLVAEALLAPNPASRRRAARVLGRFGPTAAAAIPQLVKATGDANILVRVDAAAALARVSAAEADRAVRILVEITRTRPIADDGAHEGFVFPALNAIDALGELGALARPAIPALRAIAANPASPEAHLATAALKKIGGLSGPMDEPREDPVGSAQDGGSGRRPTGTPWIDWPDVRAALGSTTVEEGRREGQRYLLHSKRLLVVEGKNALGIFFPPSPEGLSAGQAFLSSALFTGEECRALDAVIATRADGETTAGRFKASLGSVPDDGTTLPGFWVVVRLEPSQLGDQVAVHASSEDGVEGFDDLFTTSRYRAANKVIRSALRDQLPEKELGIRVRAMNNLAKRAGYSAADLVAAVEEGIAEAKRKGTEPELGISSVGQSLAFRAALTKDALTAWRSRGSKR
jgi:hypothetical protein